MTTKKATQSTKSLREIYKAKKESLSSVQRKQKKAMLDLIAEEGESSLESVFDGKRQLDLSAAVAFFSQKILLCGKMITGSSAKLQPDVRVLRSISRNRSVPDKCTFGFGRDQSVPDKCNIGFRA